MLSIEDLTRTYGDRTVLDGVSFDVRPGVMTGFVGANGAGKTTTMRIVVGVLAATSGRVRWDGEDIDAEQRRSIGYMPEERGLYPKMSPLDQLVFFGRLHGLSSRDARDRARMLLTRLGLEDRLDEPFSGLDPVAVDAMAALLRDEVAPEVPVLFSSHQLELVERLCDDLVVLSEGRLVASGTVAELRAQQDTRFRLRLAEDRDAGWLRDLGGIDVLDVTGASALLSLDGRPPEHVLAEVVSRAPVAEFAPVQRPLSDIYREVVR